jgi:uncharacterized protein YjbI with pentapeptide repeats
MPQDYSHQNLRGRSFKGQKLVGANFSSADIRSCDFSGANLRGANFSHARAGLQYRWINGLILASLTLASTTGYISGLFKLLSSSALSYTFIQNHTLIPAVVIFMIIGLLLMTFIRYGLTALTTLVWIVAVCLIFPLMVILVGIQVWTSTLSLVAAWAGLWVIAGILTKVITETYWRAGIWAGTEAIVWTFSAFVADPSTQIQVLVMSGVGAWVLAMIGSYIVQQAVAGDAKFTWIRLAALAVGSLGGTTFYSANLANADFTKATLRFTNLAKANLACTCWHQTQKLDLTYAKNTYLMHSKVRKLVTSRQGQELNFDYQNLRGVNLQGANLQDASFIGADLSEANLQDADLTRVKLVQTQLDGTDFTGATLTGAFIEDWNITTDTTFDGVRCEYVYMRLPTPDNPDPHRKPDNRQEVFAPGEFGDFIKPIFDTLDLYHSQGVDPRAIAISFKRLAENNSEADLRIVGMEVRGEDKFLLRAKTAIAADKSQLSAEYFATYNQLKALAEQEVQKLIAQKDNTIADLQTMVVTALQRPNFYAQTYQNQGDTIMPEGSKRISHFNLQGAQFAGGIVDADTVNAHQIGGNITNYNSDNKLVQTEPDTTAVKTILILASNPKTTSSLRLDQEVREIDAGLQRAKKRELFDLKQRWAVRVQDVYQSFLDLKPQFVHFSGHGVGDDGLALEDETGNVRLVDTQALAGLFELFASSIECVVLNACYSEVQASAIALHIPYVIGMSQEIGDQAAIKFATGFYNALLSGESVEFAYKLGCSVIQLEGIPEHLTPVLKKK